MTTETMQTVQTVPLFCVNMLHTGCAFGITPDGTQTYIPASVVRASNLAVGDTMNAVVIPNTGDRRERTPLFAVRLLREVPMAAPEPEPEPEPEPAIPTDIAEAVRTLVLSGGIWSQGKLFRKLRPGATRESNLTDYNKVNHTIRAMFKAGECVRLSLWTDSEHSKPGFEWFAADRDTVLEALGGK
jgi:hypothetical protein